MSSTEISPLAPATSPSLPEIVGVRLATAQAGIRYKNRTDVLYVALAEGTQVAGVFTRSRCPSAPVDWCREALTAGEGARALVVNSGNANAFTGMKGRDAVALTAEIAAEAGVPVILNPAPAPAEVLRPELLRHLYAITPNRSEAARISGIEVTDMAGARRAAEAIHAMGVRNVVITLGGDGSLIYDGGRFEYVDAFRVAAVDTTAAGDTYNGVLACCMAEGQGLVEAAREASAAAAISVTRMGAQTAAPTRKEVKEFLVNRE